MTKGNVIRLALQPWAATVHSSMAAAQAKATTPGQQVFYLESAADLTQLSTAQLIEAINHASASKPIKSLHTKKEGMQRLWSMLQPSLNTVSAVPSTVPEDPEMATKTKAKKARTKKTPAKAPKARKPKAEGEVTLMSIPPADEVRPVREGSFLAWLADKLSRKTGLTRAEFAEGAAEFGVAPVFSRWINLNFAQRLGYGIDEIAPDRFVLVLPKGVSAVPPHRKSKAAK